MGKMIIWSLVYFHSFEANNDAFRDATGTVQKSRKLSLDRGSGGRAPSGVQGRAPWWGFKSRAFSQSELPRKPPIDTHGRYTCIQYMHGGTKERRGRKKRRKKKKGKKKVGRSEKVGIPTKVRKNGIPVLLKYNFFRASFLHLTKDTDSI